MTAFNTTYLLHEDTHPLHKVLLLMQAGAPKEQVEACLQTVPQSVRNSLYGKVYEIAKPETTDPQWGEHHATEDYSRLIKAIHSLAIDTFRALPERLPVHEALYDIACRPAPCDLFWDLHHPEEDPIRLLAALKRTNNIENPKIERRYTYDECHCSLQRRLPLDLFRTLSTYFQANEVALLETTCLSWRDNLNDPNVWKMQCIRAGIDISGMVNYKDAFARPNIPEAFSKEEWQKRGYPVGYEPPLPWNIRSILNEVLIKHIVLVPAGITFNYARGKFPSSCAVYWHEACDEHGDVPISIPSYWIMDPHSGIIPKTQRLDWRKQDQFIEALNKERQAANKRVLHVPPMQEATTLCFTLEERGLKIPYGQRSHMITATRTRRVAIAIGGSERGNDFCFDDVRAVDDLCGYVGFFKFSGHSVQVTWPLEKIE